MKIKVHVELYGNLNPTIYVQIKIHVILLTSCAFLSLQGRVHEYESAKLDFQKTWMPVYALLFFRVSLRMTSLNLLLVCKCLLDLGGVDLKNGSVLIQSIVLIMKLYAIMIKITLFIFSTDLICNNYRYVDLLKSTKTII